MNFPKISVIIPTHNRAWTLRHAVDSVLAQDYPDFELIVVDDGSTDETPELLESYGDGIRVLTQANQGVSAARNRAIKASRGDLIAFLDSDDAWEPGKLACQAEFFMENPEAMICQTEEIWIRNGRRVNPMKKHKKPSGHIFEASLKLCLVSPSAVMMRRELFDIKGMFKEDYPVCEDYDLWLRVSRDMPVYLIDKPYTIKRGGHEDQLSSSHSQDKYRIAAIVDLMAGGELTPDQYRAAARVLEKKCRIYGNGCIKRGRQEEGETYLALYNKVLAGNSEV